MELRRALQELADDVKNEIIRRLHSRIGINPRTRTNTLIGSNLEKSIDVSAVSDTAIIFEIADYYEYVVGGWRKTGNFPNTARLFIRNITEWVRSKNIRIGDMTQNEIVWYLYKRMLIEGREIAPRPFIESGYKNGEDPSKVLPFLDDFFDKWCDRVVDLIMNDVDKYFN